MSAQVQNQILAELQSYVQPIFGFAVNRTNTRQDAEDLAQEIMLQLVKSVVSGIQVVQLNAYAWTVARHTWANWLKTKSGNIRYVELDGVSDTLMDESLSPAEELLMQETIHSLHREITYLSGLRRQIVVLYYYDELKQSEIAEILRIPVATVKWHLHAAKSEIREGMFRMPKQGRLSFHPAQFVNMGHTGTSGAMGDTSNILRSSLAQNIVYAVYQQPLSIQELSEELGTASAFIEDELSFLAEYDYVTEVSPGKYQSKGIVLWDLTEVQMDELHRAYQDCAAEIADATFDALSDIQAQLEKNWVTLPRQGF